jgi:hypothetical protein
MRIADLLYRSALSLLIKLTEFLQSKNADSKIQNSKFLKNKNGLIFLKQPCERKHGPHHPTREVLRSLAPEFNQAPFHGFNAG